MTTIAKIIIFGILGLIGVSVIPYIIGYSFRRGWDEAAEKKKTPENNGLLMCSECLQIGRENMYIEKEGLFFCPKCAKKDGEK